MPEKIITNNSRTFEVILAEQHIGGGERVNVLGVGISITHMAEAVAVIQAWIERGERHYVCVTPVHGVMECQVDEELRRIHNASGLTVPDGMPLVWAGRLHGFSRMGRVFGPELMLEVCRTSVNRGYTHFLYGGRCGRGRRATEAPDAKVSGHQNSWDVYPALPPPYPIGRGAVN